MLAMAPVIQTFLGSLDRFNSLFSSGITTLPKNVVAIGWSARERSWFCAPERVIENAAFKHRVPATLQFLSDYVLPRLADQSFWLLLCFYDGWRERMLYSPNYLWQHPGDLKQSQEWQGEPGSIPILSSTRRWIACYGAHHDDPSAVLLPEAHYLIQNQYGPLFATIRTGACPWSNKAAEAIYCGGDHGEIFNYFPPLIPERPHPRRYLALLAQESDLPIHVHLGGRISQQEQMRYKYIMDIDGYARTWDAWAWKMSSGSAVLSVASPWTSFFTQLFEAWTHYIPIANDYSDLAEKLKWCRNNDATCQQIATQAQQRAREVYKPDFVARLTARQLRKLLTVQRVPKV